MIRAFEEKDLTAIMQIWLDTNIKAHYFIPASNEPSGHACMHIWRLPRGSNTPLLCSATNLMPRCLQRGI